MRRLATLSTSLLLMQPALVQAATNSNSSPPANFGEVMNKFMAMPEVQFVLDDCARFGWWKIGLQIAFGYLIGFVCTWLLSRFFAGQAGTLRNTFLYYLWNLILAVGSVLALAAAAFILGPTGLLLLIPLALVWLVAAFLIPMRVYEISFLRTLAFIIVLAITNVVANVIDNSIFKMPWSRYVGKTPAEFKAMVAEWEAKRPQAKVTDASTPAAATETDAAKALRMYNELTVERQRLNPADAGAVQRFNERAAEYDRLKARLTPPAK